MAVQQTGVAHPANDGSAPVLSQSIAVDQLVYWRCGVAGQRGVAQIRKGCGERVAPITPSVLSFPPPGVEKLNFCMSCTKNKNSSIVARFSPRHARLPGRQQEEDGGINSSTCSFNQSITHAASSHVKQHDVGVSMRSPWTILNMDNTNNFIQQKCLLVMLRLCRYVMAP